jgi:hypothetical protein
MVPDFGRLGPNRAADPSHRFDMTHQVGRRLAERA